jgi:hypothetical protein
MSLRERTRPGLGMSEPCLPSRAKIRLLVPVGFTRSNTTVSEILARRGPAVS